MVKGATPLFSRRQRRAARRTRRVRLALLVLVVLLAPSAQAAPLANANADMDRMCQTNNNGNGLSDRTGPANDNTADDFRLGTDGNNGGLYAYFGMNYKFRKLILDVSDNGDVDGRITWEYWNGAWTALAGVTDGTNHFNNGGVNSVTWTMPGDWVTNEIDAAACTGSRYNVRAHTTTDYTNDWPRGRQASPAVFNVKVHVQNELGAAMTGLAQSAFQVTSGTTTTIFDFRDLGGGDYELALDVVGADHNFDLSVAVDGYVTSANLATGTLSTSLTDLTSSPFSLQFAYKVTGVTNEISGSLTGVTVRAGNAFGTTCTESGGAWYCAVPLADTSLTIEAAKDSYVTNSGTSFGSDRTAGTDAQVSTSVGGVQFAYKVTGVTNEISGSLTSVTVRAGNSYGTTCSESGGAWYCAVPVADTSLTIEAAKDGYVTNTGTTFGSDRTAAGDAQVTAAVGSVLFAYKVTTVDTETLVSLSSVTVRAGNSFGTTCTESAGDWFCPVPLADTSLTIEAAKDGYVTDSGSSFASDRAAASDGQVSGTVGSVRFAYKVTGVTTEASASLTSVTVRTGNSLGTTCSEVSGAWYCAVPLADTAVGVEAAKDGYVTDTATSFGSDRTAASDAQVTVGVGSVRYGFKVSAITNEISGALSSVTVHTGDALGTTCTESAASWYCPVPLANTELVVRAAKDGYVTNTATSFGSDRTSDADAQVSVSVGGVQFGFKVTGVTNELSGSLTTVTVKAGNAYGTTCTESAGAWYCPVPLADTSLTIQAAKEGYVTNAGSSFGSDRTSAADAQVTASVGGVQFAYKVTSVTTEQSVTLTGGTAKAGDAYGTTCTESSGVYYCPVPLADTSLTIRYEKDGYVTNTANSFGSDRTSATDAQVSASVTGVLYTVKITIDTETSLSGVTWDKKIGAGPFNGVTPDATNANVAYFAQTPSEADLVFRATKYGVSSDTGAPFTASASAQTASTISLVGSLTSLSTTAGDLKAGVQTTYTFGFTTTHVWPVDGKWAVTFPAAYTIGSPGVTLTGADGTATASVAGQVVTITRAGDGTATPGSTAVTVALTQITNPGVSGTTGTFSLALKNAATVTIDSGTAPAVTLTPGDLTALSTSAPNLEAGATTTYTFGFTNANPWPANGKVRVTFPAGYTFGSPGVTLTGADGTASASVAGQVATVTRSNDGTQTGGATAITVALTQITNPTAAGSTGTFALIARTSGDVDIDTGAAPAVTIVAAPLATITVSPATVTLAVDGTQTFTASGADQYGNPVSISPTWSATCGSINVNGDYTAPTVTGTCTVQATQGAISGTATVTVDPGPLDHLHLSPDAPTIGAGEGTTFTATGHDQYHNVRSASPTWSATCGTIDGAGAYTAPTTTGTCDVTGTDGTATGTTTVTVVAGPLDSITVTPATADVPLGDTQDFDASGADQYGNNVAITPTWTTSCGTIDSDGIFTATGAGTCTITATEGTVSGTATATVVPGVLGGLGTAASNPTAGGTSQYTFSFTLSNPWPANGKFKAVFPAGYTFGTNSAVLTPTNGGLTTAVSGQNVTVTRTGTGTALGDGAVLKMAIKGVINPTARGDTPTFAIGTWDGGDAPIDNGDAPGVNIGPLLALSSKAQNLVVSATTTYTLGFKSPAILPADGKILITFPAESSVGSPTVTLTGVDGTFSTSVSGLTVTITRSGTGTATAANTAITAALTNITSAPTAGVTGTFQIVLRDAADTFISKGFPKGVILKAGALTVLTSSATNRVALEGADYTFGFTLGHSWNADGVLIATFPGLTTDPNGFKLGSTAATMTGIDGTVTASIDGHTLRVERGNDGTATSGGTALTLTVPQVTNPLKSAGAVSIKTYDVDTRLIDQATMPVVAILVNPLAPNALLSTSHPSGIWKANADVTLTWKVPKDTTVDGYSWATDADPDTTVDGTGLTVTLSLADGQHDFRIMAHNASGDWGEIVVYPRIYVDVTAPEAVTPSSSTHPPTDCAGLAAGTFTWTASSDATAGLAIRPYRYSFDGGPFGTTALTTIKRSGLTSASHTLTAQAVDKAGNVANATYTFEACPLPGTAMKAGSLIAGTESTYTFLFKSPREIPANAKIVLEFPAAYSFGTPAASFVGIDGNSTVSVSGSTVTVTRAGDGNVTPVNTAATLSLTQVRNSGVSGSTGTATVRLTTAADVNFAKGTTKALILKAGALTLQTTSAGDRTALVPTSYTFGYRATNPWPNDGRLLITFPGTATDPNGFEVTSPTVSMTGVDGTATITASGSYGRSLTIVRNEDGTTVAAGTDVTITVTGIRNPIKAGSSGVFSMTVETAAGVDIDLGKSPYLTILVNNLAPSALSSTTNPAGTWKTVNDVVLKWIAPKDTTVDGYSWALDANPDTTIDGTAVTTTLADVADGEHELRIQAHNSSDSWGPIVKYSRIKVDATPPASVTISSSTHPGPGCGAATTATFTWTASSDATSGLAAKPYGTSIDGATASKTTKLTYTKTDLASGSHTFRVYAYDVAGNSVSTTYNFDVC